MKNAPVYFTVAQVRFNPVLKLEGYLSSIQDCMRMEHFPDFKRIELQQLLVPFGAAAGGGQPPAPVFTPQGHCVFGNMEKTTEFILQANSLALQTTAYDTFENFLDTFSRGLTIINDALKLDFSERIGLRYLDAVLPRENEQIHQYLTPEVIGLSEKLDRGIVHVYHETVSTDTNCQLISRVLIKKGRVGLPADLLSMAPGIDSRFTQREDVHAIIDTDAYVEKREQFDVAKMLTTLNTLHDVINTSFIATVTPHALSVWA